MQNNWLKNVGLVVLVIIVSLLTVNFSGSSTDSSQNLVAEKVLASGEIRIGYIIWAPFMYKDESTGKLTGISYDIVEAAAKKLNLKTNWVEEVGWGTSIEGLKTGRYDILGTQIWPNSARAREAVFSVSPFSSVLYAYGKTGDNRFIGDLSKINSDKVTVVTTDGDAAVSIANESYPLAKLSTLSQTSSHADSLLNIINGKADVTFTDSVTIDLFNKTNPGKIQQLGDTPVRTFGLVFAFARGEHSFVSMWNVALGELINDGSVERVLEKYNVSQNYQVNK